MLLYILQYQQPQCWHWFLPKPSSPPYPPPTFGSRCGVPFQFVYGAPLITWCHSPASCWLWYPWGLYPPRCTSVLTLSITSTVHTSDHPRLKAGSPHLPKGATFLPLFSPLLLFHFSHRLSLGMSSCLNTAENWAAWILFWYLYLFYF